GLCICARSAVSRCSKLHSYSIASSARPSSSSGTVMPSLFDDLIGKRDYVGRHLDPERAGGLEVEDEAELGRPLHRHVARLFAFQYPRRVGSHLVKLLANDRAIVHQPALAREFAPWIGRGHAIASRQA